METAMPERAKCLEDIKSRVDRFDAQAAGWEAVAATAHPEMVPLLRRRRDEALYAMSLVGNAAGPDWKQFVRGANDACEMMDDALERALLQQVPGGERKTTA
jgi:hypothetical protein